METIRARANKVFSSISRYFPSKGEFDAFLQKSIANSSGSQVSKHELTKFFKNVFLTVGEKDISHSDLEGFLSVFRYNNHGYTNTAEITPTIFE